MTIDTTAHHVVIDTTGLKVFGAGEWYVCKHGMGRGRRRTWRKLHLGVDEASKENVSVDLTTSGIHDGRRLPELLERTPFDLYQVSADKAYAMKASAEIPNRRDNAATWRMLSCRFPASTSDTTLCGPISGRSACFSPC